jgi:hypothetical protein
VHTDAAIDAEDGADRGVDVDIGGSVQRVEENSVLADWVLRGDWNDVVVLLGAHHTNSAGVLQTIL